MDDLIHYHNNNYRVMDDADDAEGRGGPHQAGLTLPDLLTCSGARRSGENHLYVYAGMSPYTWIYITGHDL